MANNAKRKRFNLALDVNDYLFKVWRNMPLNACKGKGKKGGKGKK